MTRQNNQHRRALEKIAANPAKFGFNDVVFIAVEPKIYNVRRLLGEPDLFIETSKGIIHVVEYKGNGNGEHLQRAEDQLRTAVWWLGKYRPEVDPKNIRTSIISGTDPKYRDLFKIK